MSTTWTEDRVELLKTLWAKGFSAGQIVKQMGGVTRNAVIGKIHRLRQPKRLAPRRTVRLPRKHKTSKFKIDNEATTVKEIVRQATKDGTHPQDVVDILASEHGIIRSTSTIYKTANRMGLCFERATNNMRPATPQERARARDISIRSRLTHRERITALHGPEPEPKGTKEPHGCRFIEGDPKEPDWCYCGHEVSGLGSSWCPWHLKLVWNPAPRKRYPQPSENERPQTSDLP